MTEKTKVVRKHRKKALHKVPRIRTGRTAVRECSINIAAQELLAAEYVAIVLNDNGGEIELCLAPVSVPANTVNVVSVIKPISGCVRLSLATVRQVLECGRSYQLRWDDVRECLVFMLEPEINDLGNTPAEIKTANECPQCGCSLREDGKCASQPWHVQAIAEDHDAQMGVTE